MGSYLPSTHTTTTTITTAVAKFSVLRGDEIRCECEIKCFVFRVWGPSFKAANETGDKFFPSKGLIGETDKNCAAGDVPVQPKTAK